MKTLPRFGWFAALALTLITASTLLTISPASQAAEGASVTNATLSALAAEVLKLAQAGMSEEVMLAYVQNAATTFDLSANQMVILKDAGVPSKVITAMLNHDNAIRSPQGRTETSSSTVSSTSPQAASTGAPASQSATATNSLSAYSPPASLPAKVAPFYDSLAPYGTWTQSDDLGWCWQPREAKTIAGWQPYLNSGRWLLTELGWYWDSSYPWGWAAFHYGRWYLRVPSGWVWVPDTTWASAWVTWRVTGSYCGWAPMPVGANFDGNVESSFQGSPIGEKTAFGLTARHFCFIPTRYFYDRNLVSRRLPPPDSARMFNNSTVVNNLALQEMKVANQGISPETVSMATHAPITWTRINDLPSAPPIIMGPPPGGRGPGGPPPPSLTPQPPPPRSPSGPRPPQAQIPGNQVKAYAAM